MSRGAERDAQGRTGQRGNVPRTGTGRAGTGGRMPRTKDVKQTDSKGNVIHWLTNKLWGK